MKPTSIWTSELVERLTLLHSHGWTLQAIADELKAIEPKVTRNSVSGQIARLHLKRPDKPKAAATISAVAALPRKGRPAPVIHRHVEIPIAPKPEAPKGHEVGLLKLTPLHCRDVLPDKGRDGFARFCGAPVVEGRSWCRFHLDLYTKPSFYQHPNQHREEHDGQARQ